MKRILPVLFKHARDLTRTLGGNPDAAGARRLGEAAAARRARGRIRRAASRTTRRRFAPRAGPPDCLARAG